MWMKPQTDTQNWLKPPNRQTIIDPLLLAVNLHNIRVFIAELRRPEGPPSGAPYLSRKSKGNPWVDFLMVIMASGIARGRVRTTTTTELPNMAADGGHTTKKTQPWFNAYFVDIKHPYYDQLPPVKTRYPLTGITWPYRGLKFTAHRAWMFLWSWPLTKSWFFRLDRGLMLG